MWLSEDEREETPMIMLYTGNSNDDEEKSVCAFESFHPLLDPISSDSSLGIENVAPAPLNKKLLGHPEQRGRMKYRIYDFRT